MNITMENKKQKAIELMNKLDIYKPYIKGFRENNQICFFENFGGFWTEQEPELMAKIQEFEKEHNCLVYAVTHEFLEFGECYDFLFISDYEEDWDEMLYPQGNMYYAFAYIMTGTCGRWDGNYGCGTFIKSFDDFQRMIRHLDRIKVTDKNGHLIVEGYHHDGNDRYELKRLTRQGYDYPRR